VGPRRGAVHGVADEEFLVAHRNCETGACTRSVFVTNIGATGLLEGAHVPAPSRAPRSRGKASDQRKGGAFLFLRLGRQKARLAGVDLAAQ